MEIIWKKQVTTKENGTFDLQLEDWSKDYPGTFPFGSIMAAYPVARADGSTLFGPRRGQPFRCSFNFPNVGDAQRAAEAIAHTGAELSWYAEYIDRKDYLPCLTGNVND